jgi:hypothetical protein
MTKTEKTPHGFDDEELSVLLITMARISTKLQNIKRTYRNPKDYSARILKDLEHKKNLAQAFIIFGSKNMDQKKLYSPSYFKNEIEEYMRDKTLNDPSDILAAMTDESNRQKEFVSSNEIYKALITLEREIGLINIPGKDKIKKIRGKQKIDFLGRPSRWQLPSSGELMKIMSKLKAIEIIIKGLIASGLLPHLQFIWEASFYVIRDQARKKSVYELAKIAEKSADHLGIKIDQQGWESHHNLLLSIPAGQLEMLAHRLSMLSINQPEAYRFILLIGLFTSP